MPRDSVDLARGAVAGEARAAAAGGRLLAATSGAIDGRPPVARRRAYRGAVGTPVGGRGTGGRRPAYAAPTHRTEETPWATAPSSGTTSPRRSRSTASARPPRPGSGHPTSSMSAAHLLAVLFADHLRFDVKDPTYSRQRPVRPVEGARVARRCTRRSRPSARSTTTSCSRSAPMGSPVQGHPAPRPRAPVGRRRDRLPRPGARGRARDGARDAAGRRARPRLGAARRLRDGRGLGVGGDGGRPRFHGVGNLTAILDLNRLGQRGPTMHGWHADVFRDRAEAFGWSAIQIDGHDVDAIDEAYRDAVRRRPAHDDRRADREGPRRVVPRRPGGLARQGGARRAGSTTAIAELGGVARHPRHAAVAARLEARASSAS